MKFTWVKELSNNDKKAIIDLWNNEYPKKLHYQTFEEFEDYLLNLTGQNHLLVMDKQQGIQAWYVDFDRDNERWFAILIHSKLHGQGLGTKILNLAKEKSATLNGWVIDHNNYTKTNGEPYRSPLAFYIKNGFQKLPHIRLESDKISGVKIQWQK